MAVPVFEWQFPATRFWLLCSLLHRLLLGHQSTMLAQIERFVKRSLLDKEDVVASSALVSGLRFHTINPEVVRRWVSEVQTAVESRTGLVQYHALALLNAIKSTDRLGMSKLVAQMIKVSWAGGHFPPSPIAMRWLPLVGQSIFLHGSLPPHSLCGTHADDGASKCGCGCGVWLPAVVLPQLCEHGESLRCCCTGGRDSDVPPLQVSFEAARALCSLPGLDSSDLGLAVDGECGCLLLPVLRLTVCGCCIALHSVEHAAVHFHASPTVCRCEDSE